MRQDLRTGRFACVMVSGELTSPCAQTDRNTRRWEPAHPIGRTVRRPLLAILLDARGAQAGKAVLFDRQQSTAHGGDDFSFSADDPTLRPGCRQIGNGQGRTVRPDHIFNPRAMRFSHSTLANSTTLQRVNLTAPT